MDVNAQCLCGQVRQNLRLAATAFPVQTSLCHCSSCRFTSGVLCTAYLDLACNPSSFANLTVYHISENVSWLFCTTCGGHVLAHDNYLDTYKVAAGTIDHSRDVLQIRQHISVADTVDGGLATFLTTIGGRALVVDTQSADQTANATSDRREDKLQARCHCGGVEYHITPANEESLHVSSPWPDLLMPFHSESVDLANKQDAKWWMRADGNKYLAGTCACTSCRLTAGFPIQCWAFVPKVNIIGVDLKPIDFRMGSLQQFESSPGKFRHFCGTCGATVFWRCDERPDLIDVSVGLLRSPKGARAEDWLEWETGRVSFVEMAIDRELVTALEKGLRTAEKDD